MLVARYTADSFLEHYDGSTFGIFYPTRKKLQEGTVVTLDLRMKELKDYATLSGTVTHIQKNRRDGTQRAGVTIRLRERSRSDLGHLLSLAKGTVGPARRKRKRIITSIPISWHVSDNSPLCSGEICDLSVGGTGLRTVTAPIGSSIIMYLPVGGGRVQKVAGKVVGGGFSYANIAFSCRDTSGIRRIQEIVRRSLKESTNSPTAIRLPDEV